MCDPRLGDRARGGYTPESVKRRKERRAAAPDASALPDGSLVLVDAAPLVYLVEGQGPRRAAVEGFLELARARSFRLAASTLVWTELLEGPLRSGDAALAERYRILLSDYSRLVLIPVDVAVAEEAARLAALRGLGVADAVHVATAIVAGAKAVLGNDEAWGAVPECPPLLLVDEMAFGSGRPSPI
jgi:predicted nucleic acid-binding protein